MSDYSSHTDQQLLVMLRGGDWNAFDCLYEKHWDRVYDQAFKKLNDGILAKDITQDVFISLWTHRATNYIDNLEAYLFSACRNNVFRQLKINSRFLPITDLILEARTYCPQADAKILQEEFFRNYESLVSSLPPAQQTIFRMHYHEDLSTLKIAQELKIARKTVQNQLTRAITILRASLLSIAILLNQNQDS
ncbi:RNA polymerase sigma-70 factor, ECF subfamily [Pedobacter steynii]|uniref:RNA polymerase sigma-70 factor, ECF subfamily n=1 Tax=Pedobacter steynii TaxID=430522 RepID=A0A1G9NHD5_9SPHI|nr:sigma-70 family RNA polymerase sigma factor [Pedobacter steynii]NQX39304.1 sigma-70 family RNA polymerase sigma factor [Pedobacter steynii]SDL85771.1 RNA polymerase sigma-70 factor, ECF subfamily [Pedobacter steynii]